MTVISRAVSALAAAIVTVGIIVGIPLALWLLTGPLLRDGLPSSTNPVDLLLRPDDGTLLMGFLALVATVAWLVLTASIVAEFAAAVAGRPARRINLPGFRLGHSIAAALVAAILGAGPALAATASLPDVALVAAVQPPQAQGVRAAVTDRWPGPVHVVGPRDSLWRIAEDTLGDPLRWREIYDLNAGRVQPDGGRLTEASELWVGWNLRLPDDAHDTIRVQPGDTLSDLAAEYLDDPARSDDLFDANAGAPQPDGATLGDPDLIRPGWVLSLPDDDDQPPETGVPAPPDAETSSGRAADAPPQRSDPAVPSTTAPPSRAADPTTASPVTEPDAAYGADVAPSGRPTERAQTPTATPHPPPTSVTGDAIDWTAPALGMSGIVVAGVISMLALRRRRQRTLRPYRHKIAVPSDENGRWEWALTAARTDEPTSAAALLDLALRSLSHPDRQDDDSVAPIVRSARLTDAHALVTTAADTVLPPPFLPTGEDAVWSLEVDTPLGVPPEEAACCCAPFPALVTIATAATDTDTEERTLMIDLEDRAVLHIGGDRQRCVAVLRHIAAELATSTAAEDTEVLLIGFGEGWEAVNPDRLRAVADIGAALTEVERHRSETRAALGRWHMATVVEGRLGNVAADSWLPMVLLIADPPDETHRARLEALATNADGVAVVVVDDETPLLTVTTDGEIELADVQDGPWKAVQLTEHAGTHLAALLGTSTGAPVPVGPATSAATWAQDMNEDGTLPDHTFEDDSEPDDGAEPNDPVPPHDEDDDPPEQPNNGPEGGTAHAVNPPEPAGPLTSSRTRGATAPPPRHARDRDPDLDDDLAAWNDPAEPQIPMIAILGEPTVRAPGPTPPTRRSFFIEVLVYLSLHPAGANSSMAATDLWPDGHRISASTVRSAFYGARKWAGRGLGGAPEAPFVSDLQHDSTYRLRGHLLDWDLFRRLRRRGQARHEAQAIGAFADYRAALGLLRAPVLSALRPGGYCWLNNHDQRHDLQIPGFVVDAAHELVDMALATGDTATARWAADQARSIDVDVAFDTPLTDLMRVAHAEDNRAELESYAAVLLDARGFDVPEELAPESFVVLNQLLPTGPRRPRP